MIRWLTGLLAGVFVGCGASPPPLKSADQIRYDSAGMPLTHAVFRVWRDQLRMLSAEGAALELRQPGARRAGVDEYNRLRNEAETRRLMSAIDAHVAASDDGSALDERQLAVLVERLLPREALSVLIAVAGEFGQADAGLIDRTVAVAILQSWRLPDNEAYRRYWSALADAPTGGQPWAKGTLPSAEQAKRAAAAANIVDGLRHGLAEAMQAEIARCYELAARAGASLFPELADGRARRIGSPEKIDAMLASLPMPVLANYYAHLWGAVRRNAISVAVDERALRIGIQGNWDPWGRKRGQIPAIVDPAVDRLRADLLTSAEVAGLLSELLPDRESEWIAANWQSAEGRKALAVFEKMLVVHLQRTLSERHLTAASLTAAERIAADAEAALQKDPALRRLPAVVRLQPYLERSSGITARILQLHFDKVDAAARAGVEREAARLDPLLRNE